jgi:hypothetical protein
MVRNESFRLVDLLARRRYAALAETTSWKSTAWTEAAAPYWERHDSIATGADARSSARFDVAEDPSARRWTVHQRLEDPAGDDDWTLVLTVDLAASDDSGTPAVDIVALTDSP